MQTLNKKKLSNVYFVFGFLWKNLSTTTAAQHLLFFSKRSHRKLFANKWEVVLFFLFPHLPKKRGLLLKNINCFFFVEQKHCEVWTKSFEEVEILFWFFLLFCFRQQKKLFLFAFSQLGNKKKRSAFLVWTYREKKSFIGFLCSC